MKHKRVLICVIAGVIIVAGFIIANQKTCDAQSCDSTNHVTSQERKSDANKIGDNLRKGALLLDVRTPEEYSKEHALGAINLPYDQIAKGDYPSNDKNTKVYVYCQTGRRAEYALKELGAAGYADVVSLGSLDGWKKMGGAVEAK